MKDTDTFDLYGIKFHCTYQEPKPFAADKNHVAEAAPAYLPNPTESKTPAVTTPPVSTSPSRDRPFDLEGLKHSPVKDAAWFCSLCRPFLNRYLRKITTAGESQWIVQHSHMSMKHLQAAIIKGYEIGWFSSFSTPVIGLDLDFHSLPGGCWHGDEPHQFLLDDYDEILARFQAYPSLVCRSPRGIHIYYILDNPMYYDNLKILTELKLGEMKIEIKPAPNNGLRVPVQKWVLDPETLLPITGRIPWPDLTIYRPEDLFGEDYRRDLKKANFSKTEKASSSSEGPVKAADKDLTPKERWERMLQVEGNVLPFINGESNRMLQKLIPHYKACNLSIQSTIDRLAEHIARSPEYTNDLTDSAVLERRVIEFYDMKQKKLIRHHEYITQLPESLEKLLSSHPFARQRTKGIRQYFLGLVNWKALHDQSLTDMAFLYRMNDMYPYYAKNRKEGLYPLPAKVQKVWNKNYNSLLPWLKEKGVLKESGYKYCPGANISKYYEIHL